MYLADTVNIDYQGCALHFGIYELRKQYDLPLYYNILLKNSEVKTLPSTKQIQSDKTCM